MDTFGLRPERYRPAAPPEEVRNRHAIAMVGCGQIARRAHLPAYRDFGYRVVAACDVVADIARAAAEEIVDLIKRKAPPFSNAELGARNAE